jgi:TldD protein
VHDGAWGFASSASLDADSAAATARQAVAVAKALSSLNDDPVELAPEPSATATWVSGFEIDPFTVSDAEKIERLLSFTNRLLDSGKVDHADAWALQVLENKYFASSEGSDITQQRIRVGGDVNATKVDPSGGIQTMRTLNPPRAAGWERFAGQGENSHDFDGEMERMPDLLTEKQDAPSVEAGTYDLVIDPSHLFLTIHESIGHATELDRALGYEANYAGTSFATIDKLNTLK